MIETLVYDVECARVCAHTLQYHGWDVIFVVCLCCVAVLDSKVRKFVVTSETVSSSTEAMET